MSCMFTVVLRGVDLVRSGGARFSHGPYSPASIRPGKSWGGCGLHVRLLRLIRCLVYTQREDRAMSFSPTPPVLHSKDRVPVSYVALGALPTVFGIHVSKFDSRCRT